MIPLLMKAADNERCPLGKPTSIYHSQEATKLRALINAGETSKLLLEIGMYEAVMGESGRGDVDDRRQQVMDAESKIEQLKIALEEYEGKPIYLTGTGDGASHTKKFGAVYGGLKLQDKVFANQIHHGGSQRSIEDAQPSHGAQSEKSVVFTCVAVGRDTKEVNHELLYHMFGDLQRFVNEPLVFDRNGEEIAVKIKPAITADMSAQAKWSESGHFGNTSKFCCVRCDCRNDAKYRKKWTVCLVCFEVFLHTGIMPGDDCKHSDRIMTEERDRIVRLKETNAFYQRLAFVQFEHKLTDLEFCQKVLNLTESEIDDARDAKGVFNPKKGINNFRAKYDISPDSAMNLSLDQAQMILNRLLAVFNTTKADVLLHAQQDGCTRWHRRLRVGQDKELLAWLVATTDRIEYIYKNENSDTASIRSTELMITDILHCELNISSKLEELLLQQIYKIQSRNNAPNVVERVTNLFNATIAGVNEEELKPWMKSHTFKNPGGKVTDFKCKLGGNEHRRLADVLHRAVDIIYEGCEGDPNKDLYHQLVNLHAQVKSQIEQKTEKMNFEQIYAMQKTCEEYIEMFVKLHTPKEMGIYHHELYSGHLVGMASYAGNLYLGSQSSLELKIGMEKRYLRSKPPAGSSKGGHKQIKNREAGHKVTLTKSSLVEQAGDHIVRGIMEMAATLEGSDAPLHLAVSIGDKFYKEKQKERYQKRKANDANLRDRGLLPAKRARGRPRKNEQTSDEHRTGTEHSL